MSTGARLVSTLLVSWVDLVAPHSRRDLEMGILSSGSWVCPALRME